jgi:anti-sigma B factor antagonist
MTEEHDQAPRLPLAPRQVGPVSVVCLKGSIDAATVRIYESDLLALADGQDANLALDMRQVAAMDSSGLGMLLALTKRARSHGGDVVLFGVPSSVQSVLRVTGMDRVIRIFDAEAQAVSAFCA